jgi:ABC-2 type transport system permease protein
MRILSKALFKIEYKRSLKGNLIWSISLGLSLFLIVIIYPLFKDMMESMLEFMAALEETNSPFLDIMEDFGGIPENAIEYFATEGAMILQIVGGIYAAMIGFAILNKDEKESTVEVLYTLPISRTEMLSAKLLSVVINLATFTVITFLFTTLGFIVINETDDISRLLLFGVVDFVMFFTISILGLGLAVILKPNQSSMLAIIIPFPLYVISIIASATKSNLLKVFKYITPFTFAEPVGFLKTRTDFELLNMLIFLGLSVVIIFYSYKRYNYRELI